MTLPSKPCRFLRQGLTAEPHGDLSENWKLCVQSHVPVGVGRVPAGESLGEGYRMRGERGHGLQEQFSPEDGPSGVIGFLRSPVCRRWVVVLLDRVNTRRDRRGP